MRYAIQATANLLNKVAGDLFEYDESIEKLVATFFALHMAYGGGRVGQTELSKRNDSRAFGFDIFGKKRSGEDIAALTALAEAHPDCDIRIPYRGSPLPLELAKTLIVKGFASAEFINNQLRQTHFFASSEDVPDWIKLCYWEDLTLSELTDTLDRLNKRLSENDITYPGEFIQVYGAMHWIACFEGLDQTQEDLSDNFIGHIKSLSKAGKIKPRLPSGRDRERYIFGHENGSVNYGGRVFETDDISQEVVDALKAEMENKYDAEIFGVASSLLESFE